MSIFISIIHLLVCIAAVFAIMVQHRKTGGFTGNFGGTGTQSDSSGGSWKKMNALTRSTVVLTAAFLTLSLVQMAF